MKKINLLKNAIALSVTFLTSLTVNAAIITHSFTDGGTIGTDHNGGTVSWFDKTETGVSQNQLKITIDNTTDNNDTGSGYLNSSVITGIAFDISPDLGMITGFSMFDGSNNDITSSWEWDLNAKPFGGPTNVEIVWASINGINGGIYNSLKPGTNIDSVFADIATIFIDFEADYGPLTTVSNSVLRMQRVGINGADSLKLDGSSSTTSGGVSTTSGGISSTGAGVPEPSGLALMGLGFVLFGFYQRKRLAS